MQCQFAGTGTFVQDDQARVVSAADTDFGDVLDAGYVPIRCAAGHRSFAMLQQQKYELLFDLGALAFLDGYYHEAVATIAASIERFYEYHVRVFAHSRDIKPETFAPAWKDMAKQSERQIGAYVLANALEGRVDALPPQKRVELRNKVVHQGYLPTRPEALEYGEWALRYLLDKRSFLEETYPKECQKMTFETLANARAAAKKAGEPDERGSTMGMPTSVTVDAGGEWKDRTFQAALDNLGRHRATFWRNG